MDCLSRRDLDFVLYEVLEVDRLCGRSRYREHSRATFDAVLDTAARIAAEQFAPHNRLADQNEPRFEAGRVAMIPQVKQALQAFCQAGFIAASFDAGLGGLQLPVVVAQAALAFFKGANIGTEGYALLTIANANLLAAFGSEEQKRLYLPHLLSGRFFGTMCLSEPQAGSSLADILTRALPQADGSYRLAGHKMWISGGEHELAENIVHLVLARIQGAPAGVKGLSLFLVPKFLVNADGTLGARNDIALAGLNHKMGYRGTVNCVLNFGEKEGALGTLVGEPHNGLACMFHMMNEARVGVGLGAVALGYAGYRHALDYARTRTQGRPPAAKDPRSPPVRIVGHADVRRMLLAQKAYVEGGLALCLYAARLVDEERTAKEARERSRAHALLEVLTPIVKAWPSEWCLAANDLAIQVHGGYGYTREYPVEQLYRDNRLNAIHEGTNGIQALDLVGRKIDGLPVLTVEMERCVEKARRISGLELFAEQLSEALQRVTGAAESFPRAVDAALANAHVFLELAGHVVVAWLWLEQAIVAARALESAAGDEEAFYRGKLQACRFFFRWELPKTEHWHRLFVDPDTTCLDMRDAWF
ncbi:MAG: acyl-CoA dehydrogenase [Betaproteobacteria bacterium]|nr:MAG: acyl-CoA dehydrogenase [Betaproteobacteria bacterium]